MNTEDQIEEVPENSEEERMEASQTKKIWRRFKRNKLGMFGSAVVAIMILISIFSPFFSPYDYTDTSFQTAYIPPQSIHFIDEEGNFHLRPFTYKLEQGMDPESWERVYKEDKSKRYPIQFFVRGWEYELLGLFETDLHLFGVESGGTLYLLGTEKFGRDLLSRIIYGSRVSILIAVLGSTVSAILGSLIGAISGYFSGIIDILVQRVIELIQSFPKLPLWMALSVSIPPSWPAMGVFFGVIMLFSLLSWTWLAREIRGKTLSYREEGFVLAARASGAGHFYIILRHIIPNCFSHIIVVLTLTIPQLILAESALSFLGLGIQPPLVSWGVLLSNATNLQSIGQHPWIMTPGLAILITVLTFNFMGDGVRDAVDPYSD